MKCMSIGKTVVLLLVPPPRNASCSVQIGSRVQAKSLSPELRKIEIFYGKGKMRSLVCAQCHVEYYFKGDGKYLTFPWDKGFTMEDAERYYDEADYYDYIHTLSRTPILKAQHPDFEIAQQGIHAQRGVSCADCHMPYKSEGGVKFSDHHITSPLANIDRTCQTCHRESEEVLRQNVYDPQ